MVYLVISVWAGDYITSARKAYALCFKYFYFETYEKKKEKVSGWHKGYYYTHVHCICILS